MRIQNELLCINLHILALQPPYFHCLSFYSEFGTEWHESGNLLKKQNVFDDFQAGAEYLISERYTTAQKMIIEGRSNGGLLVGTCVNQKPELYGAAIAAVG